MVINVHANFFNVFLCARHMSAGKKRLTEGGNWKGKKENEFSHANSLRGKESYRYIHGKIS